MTDNWYDQMAKAMAKRATAVAGVQRWQEKVAEAEAEIEALTAAREAPAAAPAPAALAEEVENVLSPAVQNTFNVTSSPFQPQQ